jgi:hypothetical protein
MYGLLVGIYTYFLIFGRESFSKRLRKGILGFEC